MSELHLFLLATAIAWCFLSVIRKKMSKTTLLIMMFVLPFLVYVAFLVIIVALALIYGDK